MARDDKSLEAQLDEIKLRKSVEAEELAKEAELKALILEAMPWYDSEYEGDWSLDKLVEKIVEICDG